MNGPNRLDFDCKTNNNNAFELPSLYIPLLIYTVRAHAYLLYTRCASVTQIQGR